MRYSRRQLLGALASSVAMVTAACAAPVSPTPPPPPTSAPQPTSAPVTPATAAAKPAAATPAPAAPASAATKPASAPTVAASPAASSGADTRVIATAIGPVTVPANPQRIVVVDNSILGNLLALGVTPIGSTTHATGDFLPFLKPRPTTIEQLGMNAEPSLEKIVLLKPDLIIGTKTTHEKISPQLQQIAPTVIFDRRDIAWRENFLLNGETVGRKAQAEELMAAYRQRLADLRGRMGDRASTIVVSTIRTLPDHVRHMLNQSFGGGIVKEAGLKRPAIQDKDGNFEEISDERIPEFDATALFVMRNSANDVHIEKIHRVPLWQALPAVKAGHVHEVPGDIWLGNPGIQAAHLVVDDLVRHLVTEWK